MNLLNQGFMHVFMNHYPKILNGLDELSYAGISEDGVRVYNLTLVVQGGKDKEKGLTLYYSADYSLKHPVCNVEVITSLNKRKTIYQNDFIKPPKYSEQGVDVFYKSLEKSDIDFLDSIVDRVLTVLLKDEDSCFRVTSKPWLNFLLQEKFIKKFYYENK